MRINVERKIASRDTTRVRKVKGKGSRCLTPGKELNAIQAPNHTTCTHTNVMLPQKRAITSATRSVGVRCSLAASSNFRTVSTLRLVNSSTLHGLGFPAERRELSSVFLFFFALTT